MLGSIRNPAREKEEKKKERISREESRMDAYKEDRKMGQVAYMPLVLRNMEEICEVMGVGRKTVQKWVTQGAPIAVHGAERRKRYSAEAVALQDWRINHRPDP